MRAFEDFRNSAKSWRRRLASACSAWRAKAETGLSATLRKRRGGGYQVVEQGHEPGDKALADKARHEAVEAAVRLRDDVLVLAKGTVGDWRRELREFASVLDDWIGVYSAIGTPMPVADQRAVLVQLRRVGLLAIEIKDAGPRLPPGAVEMVQRAFEGDALTLLAGAGKSTIPLEGFNGCGGRRWDQRLPSKRRGKHYDAAGKAMARLVAMGLAEKAGDGESRRGEWRITDLGRDVLDALKRRP